MNARMFSANNLPCELLLTTGQTTMLRNAIENNISTDIKLSKAQISKIIQSGGFLGSLLGKLAGSINESSCSNCKKYFRSIRNNSFFLHLQLMQEFKRKCMVLEQQL